MNPKIARVDFSKKFLKQLKSSPQKIRLAFRQRYELFIHNPFDPLLNNHALTGNYSDKRSININGDWRAIYSQQQIDEGVLIIFELLGTHNQLYN